MMSETGRDGRQDGVGGCRESDGVHGLGVGGRVMWQEEGNDFMRRLECCWIWGGGRESLGVWGVIMMVMAYGVGGDGIGGRGMGMEVMIRLCDGGRRM